MANSTSNRDQIYDREATFFDHESTKNRRNLSFLYDGYGISIARDQLFRFAGEVKGKVILEYGCGDGGQLLHWSRQGAFSVGIELSQHSVARANQFIRQANGPGEAIAVPMNAEQLGFRDNNFDAILGKAILHHLDLKLALPEIRRVLKPGGVGAFLEPRGRNPLIDLYRKFTPSQRTPDEHPLVESDFQLLREYFEQVEVANFYLTALFSFVLRRVWKNETIFIFLNRMLSHLDQKLIKMFPVLERFCWITVIRIEKME